MTTRIGRARVALRDALLGSGILPPERVHLWPQTGQYPLPCAWVGLPTVREQGRGDVTLTLPVVVLVDGGDAAQFAALDDQISAAWDALAGTRQDNASVRVTSAVPDTFGPEGGSTRGIVLTTTLQMATLTLCDGQPLVDPA